MRTKIFLCIAAVFFFGAAFYAVRSGVFTKATPGALTLSATRTIVFDGTRFTPDALVVRVGDTVTFQNSSKNPFWPASNLHPSHGEYPEFDPLKPVAAGSSWKFTVSKPGIHRYHDHLASTMVGTITALAEGATSVAPLDCTAPGANRSECWKQELEAILKDKGLDAAYIRLAELYAQEPAFASTCHDQAHVLGAHAYEVFVRNGGLELTPKTSYCGYGFYHGFMEKLQFNSGDVEESKKFCKYAGDSLREQTTDAEGACYHGFGHGSVDGGDPRSWGDPVAMVKPGIELCERVVGADKAPYGFLYRCTTGAYNALEILSQEPKYKLQKLAADPYAFCETQKDEYREGCYVNMMPAARRLDGSDFAKSAKRIAQIPESAATGWYRRSQVLQALSHEYVHDHLTGLMVDTAPGVLFCRSVDSHLQQSCFEGLGGGFMKYGKPEEEYREALRFCSSSALSSSEKDSCYGYVLPRLRNWYSVSKTATVCSEAPAAYQKMCAR